MPQGPTNPSLPSYPRAPLLPWSLSALPKLQDKKEARGKDLARATLLTFCKSYHHPMCLSPLSLITPAIPGQPQIEIWRPLHLSFLS